MAALATAAAIQAIAMKKLINYTPSAWARVCLGLLPFAVLLAAYIVASDIRLAQNPSDKLLPSIGSMLAAVDRPFLVAREDGTWADFELPHLERMPGRGPHGWIEATNHLLHEAHRDGVPVG